ncbi:DUF2920 family protein [Campylobacter jejuni]|uniref:DUF2920 family protein n=1 Tax=Campylobacter jejuni TaxID=197 RepID=UPI000D31C456|nr:DUF2920 family protein [Campylobacter jejuni]ECL9335435.1 DUF2920 family protein [Campylobacter jejuni]EIE6731456.1 DUF2920 family protein [Campylobacter jejuni]KAG5260239.1 DUF2920 family protein [Campylobacter jejuni]MDT9647194.1 DUF2920 family protein [Campylobacter jejuni]MDT9671509.1 DUF2920 family protein [Campylobacter jejuni]
MIINQIYSIDSCDDVELNIKRGSKLEFRLTYDDSKEIEAIICIIPGGAEDMNSYIYIDDYLTRNYKVAVININYHCIGNRPHLGSGFYLDDIDKFILDTSLKAINLKCINVYDINSYENLNNTFIKIDQEIQKLKLNQQLHQNYKLKTHVSFLPFKNEYQNFGIMQAMDILNAIFYIKENSPFKLMGGGIRTILFGNSYGGYLANLCAKIAPWSIDFILDNSSFVNLFGNIFRLIGFGKEIDFTRYHGTYDDTLFKNIFLYLSDKTYWNNNKFSKNYFSNARKIIREPLNKEHLIIQSLYPNPKYILYHSIFDERSPFKNKENFVHILKELNFKVEFFAISQVDNKFIKNLNHGMGLSTKLFFKKHLLQILKEPLQDKICKKEVSYKCDELVYTFKEENHQIILNITN